MNDIDMDRLEHFRYRYHTLVEIDHNIIEDTNTASFLSLNEVVTRLNEQDKRIKRLEGILGMFEFIDDFDKNRKKESDAE